MKRIIPIVLILLSINIYSQNGILEQISGKVEIKRSDSDAWIKATKGMEIYLSDTISTGFGASATLDVDGSTILIKPLSRLTLDMLLKSEKKVTTSLFLQVGAVTAEVDTSSGIKKNFQVQSPFSTASVRGTKFNFDGKKLEVLEGKVAFIPGRPKRLIQKVLIEEKKKEKEAEIKEIEEKIVPEEEVPEEEVPEEEVSEEEVSEEEVSEEEVSEEVPEEIEIELDEEILQIIEESVSNFFGPEDDADTIFVNAGESVEIIIEFTPPREEQKEESKEDEDEPLSQAEEAEVEIITNEQEVVAKSVVVSDTSKVSMEAKTSSDDSSSEPEVQQIPIETSQPSSTDITIIWKKAE